MKKFFPASAMAAALVFFSQNALADKIVIDKGDILYGTVIKMEKGKLIIDTDYAGTLEIKAARIRSLITDRPVELHTGRGEALKGKINMPEPGKLALETSPDQEPIAIEWLDVAVINPPPQGIWKGNLSIGGNHNSGNTDRAAISLSAEALRKTDNDRISLGLLLNRTQEDGHLTGRNAYGSAKYDYFFSKRFYAYAGLELLNDKFQDLDLRTTVGPGIGYQLWDDQTKALALEVGISYFRDNMREGQDSDYFVPRFGINFRYKVFKSVVFTNNLLLYPGLEKLGDYKLRNEAGLITSLWASWGLKLSNILQYDSTPSSGVGKYDSQWILGIQYQF
jgi:putative salt-induced outer membrane protein YdiY